MQSRLIASLPFAIPTGDPWGERMARHDAGGDPGGGTRP